jgi:hypothetical protein
MGNQQVRLEKIPPEIQKRYNVGEKVDAFTIDDGLEGTFSFENKVGAIVRIEAAELVGTSVEVRILY